MYLQTFILLLDLGCIIDLQFLITIDSFSTLLADMYHLTWTAFKMLIEFDVFS
jgi:hypothetical protein